MAFDATESFSTTIWPSLLPAAISSAYLYFSLTSPSWATYPCIPSNPASSNILNE